MTHKTQQGVGLIEVLITALMLSVALMALATLQTRALQYNSSAYLRSQANIIAYDVFDRMRAATSPDGGAVIPDITPMVASLPGGAGNIECDGNRVCTVSITWIEPTSTFGGDNPELEQTTFTYMSRI